MKEPNKIKLTNNPSHKDVSKIPLTNNQSISLHDDYGYITSIEIKPDVDELNYKTFWKTLCWENENNSKNNSQSIQ